jgi:hypothetical protein
MEPIIERSHPARERRAIMLAERLDRFDHARSTKKIAMTLQCFDKTRRRIRLPADRREEGVAIRARQRHALMLVEQPPRALIGKIAGGKTGDLHGLLDYLFRRWRKAQFKPFGFVFPLSRYRFLTGGRHNCSPRLHVRQYTVLYKSDGIRACSTICRHGPSAQSIEPTQSN